MLYSFRDSEYKLKQIKPCCKCSKLEENIFPVKKNKCRLSILSMCIICLDMKNSAQRHNLTFTHEHLQKTSIRKPVLQVIHRVHTVSNYVISI